MGTGGRRGRPAVASVARAVAPSWPHRLLLVGWVVIAVAILVSAVGVIRSGWAPVVDNAVIAAMVVDSASLNPPLVGPPSSAGRAGTATLSHAGPLGLWLLALPTTVLGEPGRGLVLGAALISLAALSGIAVLLRRRSNLFLETLGLVFVGAMVATLGARTFADPYNPYIGILPLLLCLLATSGVVAGHHRQVWIVALAGSLAAQTHLSYAPLVVALVGLTSVSLGRDALRSTGAERRRITRRIVPVALLIGGACWIGPIIDQLFGSKNLSRLARDQSGKSPAGLTHGLDVAAEMTAIPPRWLLGRAKDQDLSNPSALRVAMSVATVALVIGLLVWAIRRRDRNLGSMATVALVGLGAAIASSARVVEPDASQFLAAKSMLLYRLFWWPVGVVFAMTAIWGVVRIVASRSTVVSPPTADRRRLAIPAVALATAGTVILLAGTYQSPSDGLEAYYRQQEHNAKAIATLPGSPDTVVLRFNAEDDPVAVTAAQRERRRNEPQDGPFQLYSQAANLVAQLRLRGIAVRFAEEPDDGYLYLRPYRMEHPAAGDEATEILFLTGPAAVAPPPDGYRLISSSGPTPGDRIGALMVPTAVYVQSDGKPGPGRPGTRGS